MDKGVRARWGSYLSVEARSTHWFSQVAMAKCLAGKECNWEHFMKHGCDDRFDKVVLMGWLR